MGGIEVKTVRSADEINRTRWNELIDRSRTGSIFHSYEFTRIIEEGLSGQPFHTVVERDKNLIGVMPCYLHDTGFPGMRYLTSYHGRGGPVIASSEEEVMNNIIENSSRIAKKTDAMFQDISSPGLGALRYNSMFLDNGYRSNIGITRKILDLTDSIDEIKEGVRNRSKRKRFEKFQDAEINILTPDREDLIEFYRRHKHYQEREEIMAKTIDFFTRLEELDTNIIIARYYSDGEVAGEHLYLEDEKKSRLYHLFTGMGEDYREVNATERIHAKMIRWAKREGFKVYDFGKNSADFRKGVFNFKDEYGAENRPVIGWRKVFKKSRYKAYQLATRAS